MSELVLIAAVANNGVIGVRNTIPWKIREDMAHFRDLTTGHPVVMGRKTYESIPPKFRPLPDRQNILITRSECYKIDDGVIVCHTIEDALRNAREYVSPIFIAGGGEIYNETIDLADRLEITEVHSDYEGDAFFPTISKNSWREDTRIPREGYSFVRYVRK